MAKEVMPKKRTRMPLGRLDKNLGQDKYKRNVYQNIERAGKRPNRKEKRAKYESAANEACRWAPNMRQKYKKTKKGRKIWTYKNDLAKLATKGKKKLTICESAKAQRHYRK